MNGGRHVGWTKVRPSCRTARVGEIGVGAVRAPPAHQQGALRGRVGRLGLCQQLDACAVGELAAGEHDGELATLVRRRVSARRAAAAELSADTS